MSDFFSTLPQDHIHPLKPYQPGKPVEELERELGLRDVIKIASNENPMGPSPMAVEAATRALREANFYPDGGCYLLRQALAERLAVQPDELVFGAGSNEIIYLLVHTFCRPGGEHEVLAPKYAFISYRLAAMAYNVPFVEAEVDSNLGCDVDDLISRMSSRTRIVFIANPNNPTGAHLSREAFERILEAVPERALLVVDEAYHEYAVISGADYARSQTYRSEARPLVVTLRTFSKIHGLSGLRVGYGIAHARLVNYLDRVRRPFNVNSIAQAAALAALDDEAHIRRSAEAARSGIPALSAAVEALGMKAYPSLGNFVLVDTKREAAPLYDLLLRRGVIVRPMAPWGLPTCLRISVGTPEQTARVTEALAQELG